jgi:hypothetical protein
MTLGARPGLGDPQPNRLRQESLPNTLGGIGLPAGIGPRVRPTAAVGVLLAAAAAALVIALLAWRPA